MQVQGAEQFRAISKALKDAGDKELQKNFRKKVRTALDPLRRTDLPASALQVLPKRGGLNRRIALSRFTVVMRTGARTAGIRLQAKNAYELRKMDNEGQNPGTVRHPTFKRRGANNPGWVTQNIEAGWFTDPTRRAAGPIRTAVVSAMDETIAEIERRS